MTLKPDPPAGDIWQRLKYMPDDEILGMIADGCHDGIAVVFDRYGRLIFSIAKRILRDEGEAEEIMQTVLLDVFQSASKFDPERGSAKVWILQYAYHRSMRRKQQLESHHFYSAEQFESVINEITKNTAKRHPDLSPQETSRLVSEALSFIDEKQRKVIEMTFFEGLTAEEIAKRTGDSPVVVRHNLYRTLKKLRNSLELHRSKQRGGTDEGFCFGRQGVINARA